MSVLVADASAIVEYLFGTAGGVRVGQQLSASAYGLHIPAVCDVEVLDAIRRALLAGRMEQKRGLEALADYRDLTLTRHGHADLLPRALGLRLNFTAYDAMYVALAELLEGTLLTADRSLARAAAAHTRVVIEQV